jgi:hypothetical protein
MKTLLAASTALALILPSAAFAQDPASPMDHSMMDRPTMDMGDMSMGPTLSSLAGSVEGSGTARLPQAEGPPPGLHLDLGSGWMGMAHGFANFAYTDHGGPRGDDMAYVQSMLMLMAEHNTDATRVQLRGMVSAEPLMDNRGYPNLLATGETYSWSWRHASTWRWAATLRPSFMAGRWASRHWGRVLSCIAVARG